MIHQTPRTQLDIVITPKYRKEIAAEYDITVRQMYEWFKEAGLVFHRRKLSSEDVLKIYETFGYLRIVVKR